MAKLKTSYICTNCGSIQIKWLGKCPDCGAWNSLVEEVYEKGSAMDPTVHKAALSDAKAVNLANLQVTEEVRFKTGLGELDQVLGGGVVAGSVVLIGGEPGIGKSTVMLQVSGVLSNGGRNVLYVSGEESASQIKMRAERLSISSAGLLNLLTTTNFEDILANISSTKYDYLVIDSIQTISSAEVTSFGGAISQVRYITYKLVEVAKNSGLTVFIIGQVTKDGNIAGPKVLEHLVDTVLYFEGDYTRGIRILRSVKNRFGSTDEVGLFEMSSKGLIEANSTLFFDNNGEEVAGKVLCPILEGTRPFLIEVQALVTPTFFQYPKRNANGYDVNRLSMLLAILEKKAGINLNGADVYLNIAGGLKVAETAADIAICACLISSFRDVAIPFTTAFIGEVGLTGEVRSVPSMASRLSECARFGVKSIYTNYKDSKQEGKPNGLQIKNISNIADLVAYIAR